MEIRYAAVGVILASLCASTALGQDTTSISTMAPAEAPPLPAEISAALTNAPMRRGIFPVTGTVTVPDQVLKVDELVFQPGSRLEFTAANSPWLAIVAGRIRFINPVDVVTITRSTLDSGTKGAAGAKGASGGNATNPHGGNGFPGSSGAAGGPGGAGPVAPKLYIYAGSVSVTGARGPLSLPNLRIEFPGAAGGIGGDGGEGGRGGNATGGRDSRSNVFHCTRGAGNGGDGGAGGSGGIGGPGGPGGDGSEITFIADRENADILTSAAINVVGGPGGAGGNGGSGGVGGGRGSGGDGSRHCGGGDSGRNGPTGRIGRAGSQGSAGHSGTITAVPVSAAPAFAVPPQS